MSSLAGRRGHHRHGGRWRRWRRAKTRTTSWCCPPPVGSRGEGGLGRLAQRKTAPRGRNQGCKLRLGKFSLFFTSLHILCCRPHRLYLFCDHEGASVCVTWLTPNNKLPQGFYKRIIGEDQLANGKLDPRLWLPAKGNQSKSANYSMHQRANFK